MTERPNISLMAYFAPLTDPRVERSRHHKLIDIIVIAVCAVLCGADGWADMERFGKAKYGLERTVKVMLDLVTVKFLSSYASKPIYLFGGVGFAMFFVAILLWIYLFIRRVIFLDPIGNSPILIGAAVILIMGFQAILMGLIAELQVRTYHESQDKRTYTVRKTINVEPLDD